MSLIDKLEDLVAKVDTEYQEKMEAVIREIVPGMPERERLAFCSWCCCHGGRKNPLPFKKQGWYGYRKRRNMYYSQKL